MTLTTKLALPTAALAVAGGLFLTSQPALAANSSPERHETMAQELAERFGLNQTEVEAFFQEKRQAKQAERQAEFEQKLANLVANGSLTEAQQTAWLERHQQQQAARQANRDQMREASPAERQAARQQQRQEFQDWAISQDIDLELLKSEFDHDRGGPRHHH